MNPLPLTEEGTAATAPALDPLRSRLPGIGAALQGLAGERPVQPLVDFARAFHFGTPVSYFAGRSDESLAQDLLEAFDFVDGRAQDEIRVRVAPGPSGSTYVQATMRDQPFLLDTARELLRAEGVSIHRYLHPILRTERDEAHRLTQVRPRPEQGTDESFLHFEVEPLSDPAVVARLETGLREALLEAAVAAEDFPQMRAALSAVARGLLAERSADPALQEELAEAGEFLRWLEKGNFIFLGYRAYDFEQRDGEVFVVVSPRSGLGLLRDPARSAFHQPVPVSSLDPALRSRMLRRIFPLVSKTNRESRVHRRAPMDYIGIKKLSPQGEVVGEHRLLGFFTSQALNQLASEIPVLRRKLVRILARAQVLEGSHDHKEIVSIFNGLPKAELLATDDEEIARTIETVMGMQSHEGIRVTCRRDSLDRAVSVMVILPRDRFSSEVRQRIQAAFATRFGGPPVDYRLALGEEHFARLHFYFPLRPGSPPPVAEGLEMDVQRAVRTWDDQLREELAARMGADRGAELSTRFKGAMPATYRSIFDPAQAVEDLPIFEELRASGGVRVRISEGPRRGSESTTLLRFYRARSKFYLSDVMPIMTNLGLRVIDELTFRIEGPPQVVYLHTIRVQEERKPGGAAGAVRAERWPALTEAILALLAERYEDDGLGALVVAGLTIRQVELLRAYLHFYRQLRVPYTRASMIGALIDQPHIASRLVGHFEDKFRPEPGESGRTTAERRAGPLARSREEILKLLDAVEDITQDRVLRGLLDLVEATIRTNYFQKGGTLPRLALKFHSARIPAMPRPVPLFEIFVHNAEMEGIHLRSGKVSRGGIRWSDRRDDYRTEVLGLMRTQLVKNAVIVPMGAKGGFVLKRAGDSREDTGAQVARQYRTLICGLLDLTDNLVGGRLLQPQETVIYDPPDPYLVVAADKGTATFSDLANSLAAEYGFWLGDGFASGGSHGYDHKKERITARGAWECVRHHFRELGQDPEGELTVAGIGDMSGDVFGNGLLLSPRFKMVAAFDHRHIFLDPDPRPEPAYQERRRLFALPRSSWADYDPSRISPGGGVFRRDQKRILLSPEARSLLGTAAEALTGEELVREILKLPVDLLWNGGIGTYVKASSETHAEVGDSRNDAARIDAVELRARVVAEGGNLGFTQAARVEYALRGGKINTDFIDNSAGVDLSDHEVNIKIALAGAVHERRIDQAGRDRLLSEMTAEVCSLVLLDNRRHTQVLSMEALAGRELHLYTNLAAELSEAGLLEAKFERFPEAAELKRRAEHGVGLVRPELALLLAFTKIEVSHALRESSLVETPGFEKYLADYFPQPLRERFADLLQVHPLRREIAVATLVNELIYRVGVTFVSRLKRELGVGPEDVVRAYRAADLLLESERYVDPVRDLLAEGRIPAALGYELLFVYRRACDEVVNWLVRTWPQAEVGLPSSVLSILEKVKPPFQRTAAWLNESAPARVRERFATRRSELAGRGAPPELAAHAASLELEQHVLPVVTASRQAGVEPERAAAAYLTLLGALRLEELEEATARIRAADEDDRTALRALLSDSRFLLVDLTTLALTAPGAAESPPQRAVEEFLASRGASLTSYLRALPVVGRPYGLGSLLVLVERLRRLAAR